MRLVRAFLSSIIIALALAGPVRADEPAPAAQDSEGFEKVDGSMMKGESIPAARLVSIAYGVIFAAVAVYAFGVARRTQRVEAELAELKSRVERAGK
jgi:heme A synthase